MNDGEASPFDDQQAAAVLNEVPGIVAMVGEDGTVLWISEQVRELGGYEPADLIGTNMLDHMDLGVNSKTLESIAYALNTPGLRYPTVIGMRAPGRRTLVVEATANNQFDNPAIGAMVVYLQVIDERRSADNVLRAIVAGEPLTVVFGGLHQLAAGEILRSECAILLAGSDHVDQGLHASDPEVGRLLNLDIPAAPWNLAIETGEPVTYSSALQLPPGIRAGATAAGLDACWAYPVFDPSSAAPTAALVLWRRERGLPEPSAAIVADQMVQLTYLAVERHNHAQSLIYAARHDPLTDLSNRAAFMDGVRLQLADRLRPTGVLYLDLDEFKAVNDGHGHHHGDEVLRAVADRLTKVVGPDHLLGRLGGDEFAICTAGLVSEDLTELADRIIKTLGSPIVVEDVSHEIGATVGISLADPNGPRIFTTDELVGAADRALLVAKVSAKGRWQLADHLN